MSSTNTLNGSVRPDALSKFLEPSSSLTRRAAPEHLLSTHRSAFSAASFPEATSVADWKMTSFMRREHRAERTFPYQGARVIVTDDGQPATVNTRFDLSKLAAVKVEKEGGKVPIADDEGFAKYAVAYSDVKFVSPPKYVTLDSSVLTPAERRQKDEFLRKQALGERLVRQARQEEERRKGLMRSINPRGVAGVDAPHLKDTEVYTDSMQALSARDARHSVHEEKRRKNLSTILVSRDRRGYDVLEHKGEDGLKFMQSRTRVPSQLPDHPDMLHYKTETPNLISTDRTMTIRNSETRGRDFNIITGTKWNYYHPTVPEQVNHRLAHPSLQI